MAFTSAVWGTGHPCADVYYKVHPWRLCGEHTSHVPLSTPAMDSRIKCVSWLSPRFAFLKLLAVWHTRVNSSDYYGVRVLLFWVCERKCVCVCMCSRFPLVSSRHFNSPSLKAVLSHWNLVHCSAVCFVFSGGACEHPRSTPYGVCTQAHSSGGDHTLYLLFCLSDAIHLEQIRYIFRIKFVNTIKSLISYKVYDMFTLKIAVESKMY